jgi:DNA polymerase alpha subunit A
MVYDEARNVMKKYNIPKFLAKPVERKYAFELDDVPAKSDYLKVKVRFSRTPPPLFFLA